MDWPNRLPVRSFLLALYAISWACFGQTAPSAGYTSPFPLRAAPGQLVTLYLQGPATGNISAVFWNQQNLEAMPVVQVSPWSTGCIAPPNPPGNFSCTSGLAVTLQIPFDVPDSVIVITPSSIAISVNGVQSGNFGVVGQPDHVHILTSCDTIVGGDDSCAPLVQHANGQLVSYQNPASGGETLIAYATGLGQTNPPQTTGAPAARSAPALSAFNLDFNYRPNALATQPATAYPPNNPPLFAGSTPGFIGLYQINFVVPPPPANLEPCSSPVIADGPVGGLVGSNFTVSVGSLVSFDGAGICVTPGS